jgi:hypothetical protein
MQTANMSYGDLYARWEAHPWSATALDFSQDRRDWGQLTEFEQTAALWNYALFFHGEDAVATSLSPFIDAAPRQEQRYFLATQQADEARHAIFFQRFFRDVVGIQGSAQTVLRETEAQLTWGFRQVFAELERTSERLRRDRAPETLAAAVCLYHLLIEATLAQTGQQIIERFLDQRQILPAFRLGIAELARDEQRHIGFGVLLLSDLAAAYPRTVPDAVAEMLHRIAPLLALVFAPPGWDEHYVTVFGTTLVEISAAAITSLESKLRAAGLDPATLPGVTLGRMAPSALAQVSLTLAQAGILDPRVQHPRSDAQTVALFMTQLAQGLSGYYRGPALALQWRFENAPDWFINLDAERCIAYPGQTSADLTLTTSVRTAADITLGYRSPLKAVAQRQLKVSGSPRALWALRAL